MISETVEKVVPSLQRKGKGLLEIENNLIVDGQKMASTTQNILVTKVMEIVN
jgi:hypothetical protein